jgi:hypothetical protein
MVAKKMRYSSTAVRFPIVLHQKPLTIRISEDSLRTRARAGAQ